MDVCYIAERGLSKKDAVARAKELRAEGYPARVLKGKKSYSVIDCGGSGGDSGTSPIALGLGAAAIGGVGFLIGKAK